VITEDPISPQTTCYYCHLSTTNIYEVVYQGVKMGGLFL